MNDIEKLIALTKHIVVPYFAVQIADYLIANGVTVQKYGKWLDSKHKIFGNTYDYVCSNCGCDYALARYKYCPNCGANMESEG